MVMASNMEIEEIIKGLTKGQKIKIVCKNGIVAEGMVLYTEPDEEFDDEWAVTIDLLNKGYGLIASASDIKEIVILDD